MKERFPKKITRRTFLTTSVKLAIGWAGILAGSSGIFFLQADKQAKRTAQEVPGHLVKLGDYNQLSAIKGVQKVSYDATVRDAWVTNSVKGFVYVKSERNGHLLIMSPSCTHLGCNIEQVPEAEPGETKGVFFRCPCHGAEFDMRGNAVGKVVLRGLDTFEPIIAKDSVYIDILSPIKGRHVIEN